MKKITSITGNCIKHNKKHSVEFSYEVFGFVGDKTEYTRFMGFEYDELCNECPDETRDECLILKKCESI